MDFKNRCVIVLWMKVASALKGLKAVPFKSVGGEEEKGSFCEGRGGGWRGGRILN